MSTGGFGGSGRRRRRWSAALLGAMALVAAVGCGTGPNEGGAADPGRSAPTAAPVATTARPLAAPNVIAGRPYAVRHETRTFVDPSRPTPAGKRGLGPPGAPPDAQPTRTLVTRIDLPDGPGPFPLVMFSHGLSGHPDKFSQLLTAWAVAGYITVAPAFPLTNDTVPGNTGNAFDLWDQPKDISFVLDQVLAASRVPDDSLHGHVDERRLGAAGLSLGGATTYGLVYDDCCRDDRFVAAEVLSGALLPLPQAYDLNRSIPILIMHGDHDASLAYSGAVDAYAKAAGPKVFVTLLGGTHAPPYENDPTPYDAMVEATTTDFWDVHLLGDASRRDRLLQDATVDGMTTVQTG